MSQAAGQTAVPRVALALACICAIAVFLVTESTEDIHSFIESVDVDTTLGARAHARPQNEVAHVLKPAKPPAKSFPPQPAATEKAMVRCNGCRQKLEAVCKKHGSFPKCKHSKDVQMQFAACHKTGMSLSGHTLVCPGDKAIVPAKVKCSECRARLADACKSTGGYPSCRNHKSVLEIAHDCELHAGLANIKGVLVCPGDAKIGKIITCEACRVHVVTKCDNVGGFPRCLQNIQVQAAYAKCAQRGLRRLPETKALICPGEDSIHVDETAVCDACRDKLQGECGKLGGYPTCLEQAEVKATLEACQKERGLKLLKGRLFCKGDAFVKPPQQFSKVKKVANEKATKKPITPHSQNKTHIRPQQQTKRPRHVTTQKSEPRQSTHEVVQPPPGLTCEACRDHLTKTCKKLGGNRGMTTCENDLRFKKIFKKIRDSCVRFRGLVQHKNGSLGCPSDRRRKINKVRLPVRANHAAKPEPTLPMMPPMPSKPSKQGVVKRKATALSDHKSVMKMATAK